MGYRKLTAAELESLAASRKDSEDRRRFVKFALDYYGPTANRVRVKVGSEYNDEYYIAQIERLSVYDVDGNRLNFIPNARARGISKSRSSSSSQVETVLDPEELEDMAYDTYSELTPPGGEEHNEYVGQAFEYYVTHPLEGKDLYVFEED